MIWRGRMRSSAPPCRCRRERSSSVSLIMTVKSANPVSLRGERGDAFACAILSRGIRPAPAETGKPCRGRLRNRKGPQSHSSSTSHESRSIRFRAFRGREIAPAIVSWMVTCLFPAIRLSECVTIFCSVDSGRQSRGHKPRSVHSSALRPAPVWHSTMRASSSWNPRSRNRSAPHCAWRMSWVLLRPISWSIAPCSTRTALASGFRAA